MRVPRLSSGLLVAVLIWALPLVTVVLMFGGEQMNPDCWVNPKVGDGGPLEFLPPGCSPSLPGPIPVIGTQAGAVGTLVVAAVGWLVALALLLRQTWRHDRRTFVRVVVAAGAVGAAVGTT